MTYSLHMPSKNPPLEHQAPARDRKPEPPPSSRRRPRLDEHVVEPESNMEMVRGRIMKVAGAHPPHADTQYGLPGLLVARQRDDYIGAAELLSHLNEQSDFATDVCIRKKGIDPETDERYLEELVFEIISKQRPGYVRERAEDLSERGVRHIVGIFVDKGRVAEWSKEDSDWRWLPLDGVIEDPCLIGPLPVKALLEATSTTDVKNIAVQGFIETKHPAIEQVIQQGMQQGLQQGMQQGLQQGMQQGLQQGMQQGLAPLVHQFERRLGRPLTAKEHATLIDHLYTQGPERVGDVVLDSSKEQLADWLAPPGER